MESQPEKLLIIPSTTWLPPLPEEKAVNEAFESFADALQRNLIRSASSRIQQKISYRLKPEEVSLFIYNTNEYVDDVELTVAADITTEIRKKKRSTGTVVKEPYEAFVDPLSLVHESLGELEDNERNVLAIEVVGVYVQAIHDAFNEWSRGIINASEYREFTQSNPIACVELLEEAHALYEKILKNDL